MAPHKRQAEEPLAPCSKQAKTAAEVQKEKDHEPQGDILMDDGLEVDNEVSCSDYSSSALCKETAQPQQAGIYIHVLVPPPPSYSPSNVDSY